MLNSFNKEDWFCHLKEKLRSKQENSHGQWFVRKI